MHKLDVVDKASLRDDIPAFRAGDNIKVHVKVIEGTRSRVQVFQGVCIRRHGGGIGETYTVRKVSFGVGVERTFPLHSPVIEKIEVVTAGDDLDLLDDRAVQREGALDTDAEADLANGVGLADAATVATDADALEHLDTRARALNDLDVNLDVVTGAERRDVVAQACLVDVVELVHVRFAFSSAPQVTHGLMPSRRNAGQAIRMGCSCNPSLVALPLWQGHEIGARCEESVCHSGGASLKLGQHLAVPSVQVGWVQPLDHVRSAQRGTPQALIPSPASDLSVVPRQQDFGYAVSAPQRRLGEHRVLQQAILVGLLHQ